MSEQIKTKANFDWWIVYGFRGHSIIWIRLRWLNYGLSISTTHPRFSIRQGIKKTLMLGKYRFEILKARGV